MWNKSIPIGLFGMLVFNTKIPPLDNAKLRRALLFGVNQSDCMLVVVGSQPALMRTGVGVFPPGTPLATDADMDVLTTPRDLDQVRRLVQESGYKGERIAMMVPTDSYALSAFGNVIHQMMTNVGLNMDYQPTDWATLVSRRNQVETGGWNCYSSNSDGLSYMTPGTHWRLLATAPDPRMVALKQAWFNAPDLATQRQVAEQVQRCFFEDPPFLPLGQYLMPWAYRAGLTDIVHAPQSLFWGMRRA